MDHRGGVIQERQGVDILHLRGGQDVREEGDGASMAAHAGAREDALRRGRTVLITKGRGPSRGIRSQKAGDVENQRLSSLSSHDMPATCVESP